MRLISSNTMPITMTIETNFLLPCIHCPHDGHDWWWADITEDERMEYRKLQEKAKDDNLKFKYSGRDISKKFALCPECRAKITARGRYSHRILEATKSCPDGYPHEY